MRKKIEWNGKANDVREHTSTFLYNELDKKNPLCCNLDFHHHTVYYITCNFLVELLVLLFLL